MAGRNTLIAAPTGSGKTLAAFLVCIDRLLRSAAEGTLADEIQVVYVSPLKALSNDVHRNLEVPLAQILGCAKEAGMALSPLRVGLRTGDTPASQRQSMLRRPPHILVTTPESLYLLLTSVKGRAALRAARTVIVDEIHALARDKRGSHLALSLARLDNLCDKPPVRIGLSATQRPIDEIARFLVGTRSVDADGRPQCEIVDTGHVRELDLAVEVPETELSAACSHETWDEIYRRITELIQSHRSTLVFVNTRRLAERVCHYLAQLLGEDAVASHHGSLSREIRLSAEQRLQTGQLKAIVATASLELGIDVGYMDLVCQVGSPRSIATLLQRVGRSGHSLGALPKGRLFPLTRDELLECLALVHSVRQGFLDKIEPPVAPLDILAQQIVAETACGECAEEDLFELVRKAWPYRNLTRKAYEAILEMVSEGIGSARHGALVYRDRIHRRLRGRRGARISALTSGGAIPDTADYRVVTLDEGRFVGTVNEDFAIESQGGDVFLLGNTSWRVKHVRGGQVVVEDAHAAPATIPFWLGEAPGRTIELSSEIAALRSNLAGNPSVDWLVSDCGASLPAARQAVDYVAAQQAAIGLVPTQERIVFERFFDESGGMQLVIHSLYGARINRAWGLALRKRFCRSFDFELQASADDNGIVLSLGPQHSFPLADMFRMLTPANAWQMLTQALLAVPMFQVRWRWNATRALAVPRQRGGQKVPPALQRFRADDLLTAVFPAQTACQENVTGDIPIPDHPLVEQTVYDCLHEAMDYDRWVALLGRIADGSVELLARDTREPSPFCYEILNANPYAFLDDAPLEERRARAVATRRSVSAADVGDLARLDPEAIDRVRSDAWPVVRDPDELHDCLLSLAVLPDEEGREWHAWFDDLVRAGRATTLKPAGGPRLWVAAERLPLATAAYSGATIETPISLPPELAGAVDGSEACQAIVRGRLECLGPLTAQRIASDLGLAFRAVEAALAVLEAQGTVLRGNFTGKSDEVEWCQRRLLARIHRLTLDGARKRVQPVGPGEFWQFLLSWQHVLASSRLSGRRGLLQAISQLQGFETPAGAWERDVLPARLADYEPAWLDELSLAGEVAWGRLQPPRRADDDETLATTGLSRVVPISLVSRADLPWLLPEDRGQPEAFARPNARRVFETLAAEGALFFEDLAAATGFLPAQLDEALGELAALGLVTSDGFAPIRGLVSLDGGYGARRSRPGRPHRSPRRYAKGGRWGRFPGRLTAPDSAARVERWAQQLLARYGVMFRDLLARESVAPAWNLLTAVYRRWEAQGKIRGGRFVSGVGGEQYCESQAVELLRNTREQGDGTRWVVVSAADPLNLAGILAPGGRIAARPRNALALIGGRLIASLQAGEAHFHEQVASPIAEQILRALRVTESVRQRDTALVAQQS